MQRELPIKPVPGMTPYIVDQEARNFKLDISSYNLADVQEYENSIEEFSERMNHSAGSSFQAEEVIDKMLSHEADSPQLAIVPSVRTGNINTEIRTLWSMVLDEYGINRTEDVLLGSKNTRYVVNERMYSDKRVGAATLDILGRFNHEQYKGHEINFEKNEYSHPAMVSLKNPNETAHPMDIPSNEFLPSSEILWFILMNKGYGQNIGSGVNQLPSLWVPGVRFHNTLSGGYGEDVSFSDGVASTKPLMKPRYLSIGGSGSAPSLRAHHQDAGASSHRHTIPTISRLTA